MSHKAIAWAKHVKTGSTATKAVLLCLADYADEQHSCYPSQETLAEETEMSRRSVQRALERLEELGYVSTQLRYGSDGKRTSNRYVLAVQPLSANMAHGLSDNDDSTMRQTGAHYAPPVAQEPPVVEPSVNRGVARTRATPVPPPDELPLTEDMVLWAKQLGAPSLRWLEEETAAFLDRNRAKGERYANWVAAWRNWIRRSIKWDAERQNGVDKTEFERLVTYWLHQHPYTLSAEEQAAQLADPLAWRDHYVQTILPQRRAEAEKAVREGWN